MAFTYIPHSDDEKMLMDIRRYLIGYRMTNGWNQAELSQRINGSNSAAITLEKGNFDWGLRRLQKWVAAFDLKLYAVPLFTGRVPGSSKMYGEKIDEDPVVYMLGSAANMRDDWQMWQRMYLTAYLKAAREIQNISRPELGARMGITAGAISAWEIHADNVRLIRMLNVARALNGRIELSVS